MEFKGTKGKWEQITASWDLDQEVFVEDTEIIVAKVFGKPHEQIYNALLISKAPEFLKELVNEVEILKAMGLGDTERCKRKERLIKEATEL